jgi:acyl-coenzyme A synthetase/AMP-(fatty) acid ligase
MKLVPLPKIFKVSSLNFKCLIKPSLDEMLKGDGKAFSYEERTFEKAKNNPVVVLHSSESTGIPKSVVMTHGTFATLDNEHHLPGVPGRKNRDFRKNVAE